MSDKERRNSPEKLALAALDEMDLIELDDEDHDGLMTIWRDMIAKYIRAAVAEAEARCQERIVEVRAEMVEERGRTEEETITRIDTAIQRAREDEREACARLSDAEWDRAMREQDHADREGSLFEARRIAAAIRARGRQA